MTYDKILFVYIHVQLNAHIQGGGGDPIYPSEQKTMTMGGVCKIGKWFP